MTLLQEILDAAVRSDVPLTDLLRRCKVLASRLRHMELADWVDLELNGYPEGKQVPEYRVLRSVNSKGHFSGPFGSGIRHGPIPLSNIRADLRHLVAQTDLRQPVSAYAELLAGSDTGVFQIPWPADLVKLIATDVYENLVCMSAWREVPRGHIVGLLDTVRNRILSFALAIQEEYPNAGEGDRSTTPPSAEQVTHVFHTHITGSIGNLALGNHDVSQQQTVGVRHGDFATLNEYLGTLGVTQSEAEDLAKALKADKESQNRPGIGKRASEWLGKMSAKAFAGGLKVGGAVAAKLLTSAVSKYLGLPE